MPKELAFDLSACAGSEVALVKSRLQWQSSFSQLRLSENRRKQFSSSTTRHVACNVVVNAFQQYEGLVSLATAKLERRWAKFWLAHPPLRENGANSLQIHDRRLLKSGASRQEKASTC